MSTREQYRSERRLMAHQAQRAIDELHSYLDALFAAEVYVPKHCTFEGATVADLRAVDDEFGLNAKWLRLRELQKTI